MKLLNHKLILLILITGVYCSNAIPDVQHEQPITDRNVYDDIDMFNLKGIRKIEIPATYPYIKIEDIESNKRKITYVSSRTDIYSVIYEKQKKYWLNVIDDKCLDTGCARMYEYITPDSIIRLIYYDNKQKTEGFRFMHAAEITTKNKTIMYTYGDKKGIQIKPDITNLSFIKSRVTRIITDQYNIGVGILTEKTTIIDNGKINYESQKKYQIGNHSMFWYQQFFSFAKEIK